MSASLRLFRVIVEVSDLARTAHWYESLLGVPGRPVGGERVYFDCGGTILAVHDHGGHPRPVPQDLYFAVPDLEAVYARAQDLKSLSTGTVHGEPAGEIVRRPWGERSFYAVDPFGNGLCFVDSGTLFTG
ncbi:MAG TPA: VOC family protein [Candidatus Limnocylindrales bacterium]|nr:VOC family protein [Candidatus Limnocylindrales bacterium]